MTTAEFITILRLNCGDIALLNQDTWAGDGATQSFRTTERPIIDSNYQVYVYVGGSWGQKTETTDYTIDKDSGILTFTTAPASGSASGAPNNENIRIDYKYAFLRDDEFLQIIKEVLNLWRRKIWTYDTDEATFDTVKDQDEYDMDSISSNIIWITQMEYKQTADIDWKPIAHSGRNWLYEPELNKVIVKPAFTNDDYDIRVMYIKAITVPALTSDTYAPSEVYHPAITKKCLARYWQRFANYKLKDTGAIVKEMTYHPASEIMQQARLIDQEADRELGLIKPRYPIQAVQILGEGRKR